MAEGTATRKQGVRKNMKSPDETRRFDKGKIDIANVGDAVIGRFELQPGFECKARVGSFKPLMPSDLAAVAVTFFHATSRR